MQTEPQGDLSTVIITCSDCGKTQTLPPLSAGVSATCRRCGRLLRRRIRTGIEVPLACAAAEVALLPAAVLLPLMDSTIHNLVFKESSLLSSVSVIYGEVWFPFALGFLLFAFLFPAVRALLQVIVLGSIATERRFAHAGRFFRWSEELRIWSMTEVVVLAGLVAYFRASISATVAVGAGAWCYLTVACLALICNRSLERRTVWNAIMPDRTTRPGKPLSSCNVCEMTVYDRRSGQPCPRCGHTLERSGARRFIVALGAVAAAIPLFFPAYGFSVIVNDTLTGVLENSVLGTVRLLADRGYWQFGVVMLTTGVVIPAVEILGLIALLATVLFPTKRALVLRTRLYRGLHHLVRWPMVIPFIAALAAPIVDFPGIDDLEAGVGATPLFLLIALLMLAMRLFDPRLMWITAGEAA